MEFTPIESTLSKVEEFHNTFAIANFNKPTLDPNIAKLRIDLLAEELKELQDAVAANDMVEVLDALTDLQYVLDGAYLQFGLAHLKQMAFDEVHRSNMSKLDEKGSPIFREDGKVMKGPNYFPPNLAQFIVAEIDSSEPQGSTCDGDEEPMATGCGGGCKKCGCCS